MTPSARDTDPTMATSLIPSEDAREGPMALPIEVDNIIEVINENLNVILTNRERLRAMFDDSVGLAGWNLIPANDRTMLRDLWIVELNDAHAGIGSAINQIQQLT